MSTAERATTTMDDDARARVAAVEERVAAAIGAGDAAGAAACYADDAVLLLPRQAPIEGPAAIERHYREVFARWRLEVASTTRDTRIDGDLAALSGDVVQRLGPKGGPLRHTQELRHLLVLERRDGAWKIVRDMVQEAKDHDRSNLVRRIVHRVLGRWSSGG